MSCLPKKGKAKKWFSIISPKVFGEIEIGKTLASEPENLIGRRLTISAIEVTNDLRKYYLKLSFRITRVEGENAYTEFDGSECTRDYISRMIVRRVRRIDTVQDVVTKDGVKIRVKCIIVVHKKAKTSITKTIRKKVEELIEEIVKNSTLDDFVKGLINDEIKKRIVAEIRKIYPIRHFEIRKTEVKRSLGGGKSPEEG